jgi:transaldolase
MSNILDLYSEYGQSVWLDYLDRDLVTRGGLAELRNAGVRGVTSNPTIFDKAISGSRDYDDAIRDLLQADHQIDEQRLYEWLVVQDVQMAADVMEPVYLSSDGRDGYVSLEVSPHLAYDCDATIEAARHLWRMVDRPNLLIKVPGTEPALPAIEQLIAEGINVNITLLFSVARYEAVIEAYLRGLQQNPDPGRVASVASFFVSRIDTKVDAALDAIGSPEAKTLKGRIAIANARMAYQSFKTALASEPVAEQQGRGVHMQRPLWASTSTKNPAYRDVLYIEQLIGPHTVNTIPANTLDAFQAHGELRATLEADLDEAQSDLDELARLGISLEEITRQLEQEGVAKFNDSYDALLVTLREKRFELTKEYAT